MTTPSGRSWQEESTIISIATEGITMSTKLMNQDEKSNETESPEGKNGHTLGQLQPQGANARPNPPAGKRNTTVMTAEEVADLLAKLQDILALWPESDNKIIGDFVMTAFPIPAGMTVGKMTKKNGHDKVFCVNSEPVVSLE